MTHTISTTPTPIRRAALAALVAALLGVAAFTAMSPATASAATGSCDPGEFCMWYLTNFGGGLYEFSGSDSSLANDHFENANTSSIVDNNTESVWNRGTSDPNGYVHVVVYDGASYTGAGLCVVQGRKANLPASWQNRISSYRWANAATCNRYPHL
jgi:hypothetical protein